MSEWSNERKIGYLSGFISGVVVCIMFGFFASAMTVIIVQVM